MAKNKNTAPLTVWSVRVTDRSGSGVPPMLYPLAEDHLHALEVATNYAVCSKGAPQSALFTTVVTGRVIDLSVLVKRLSIKPLRELKLEQAMLARVEAAVEAALDWKAVADEWHLSPKVVAVSASSLGGQSVDILTLSLLELADVGGEVVVVSETIGAL
ncbi:hypothetical protein H10PHJ05_14 [Aeromonas phage HJ05]|nr:hypothetical protein H10PHJ05_14 [Aeromonas phage HJ05]